MDLYVGPGDGQDGGRAVRGRADDDVVLDRLVSDPDDGMRRQERRQVSLHGHWPDTWQEDSRYVFPMTGLKTIAFVDCGLLLS